MRLDTAAKQSLVAPLVVGSIFGALAALGVVAFVTEYGANVYASSSWSLTAIAVTDGLLTFVAIAGGSVLVFGILPIVLPRIVARIARHCRSNA